jgi:type IX secretion system PorP/SprF family membrane protein
MMRKYFKIISVILSVFFSTVKAQDFHLSMYDAGPLFLNPAMTGMVDAPWRVHAQYRNQWKAVAFKPYNTALLSFDAPVGKWGFGGQITEMRAGIGGYNVFEALGSGAYNVAIDKMRFHQLAMGIQAGVTQKSVEYNIYTFDSQYTPTNGGYFDKNLSTNESLQNRTIYLPQANAGFMYYYGKQQSRLNPFLGYSAFNLLQPQETFFGFNNNKLPVRHYAHAGIRINITELFYVLPKVLVMMQKNAYEQTYAIDLGYYMKHDDIYLLAGATYRNMDAGVIYIGARKNNYIAKIGYDINTSSLKDASHQRGAFEISFTYMAKKKKPDVIRNCPRL